MQRLRRLARHHQFAALWLVLLTLAARVMVPGGYMPMMTAEGLRMLPCAGWMPADVADHGAKSGLSAMGHAMPADAMLGSAPALATMAHPATPAHPGRADLPAKGEVPCAFAGLAMPSLGGADAVLLALAIGFIVATGIRPAMQRIRAVAVHPRPPSQAPPLTA